MQQLKAGSDHSGAKPRSRQRESKSLSSDEPSPSQLQPQKTISELFASSNHRISDPTFLSPHKRQKREHTGGIETFGCSEAETLKSKDMYTFSSSNPSGNGTIDLTGSATTSPRKKSTSQGRPNNFTPHTGTKKLVVKNFRKTSSASPDRYYKSVCTQVDSALSAIFRQEKISLEELYRGVENVCRQDRAPALFEKLYERCKNHVFLDLRGPLVERTASGMSSVELLRSTVSAWTTWKDQLGIIRSIFYYMDRSYLLHSSSQPSIEEMGKIQFRTSVFSDTTLKPMILQGTLNLIAYDRKKVETLFDGGLLREALDMFHTLSVYTKEFEPKMLGESQSFLSEWARAQISSLSLAGYVEACQNLIEAEIARCGAFGLETTTEKDLITQLDRFLVLEQEPVLVNTQDIADLMAHERLENLRNVFTLLERKKLGERLRPPFEVYIVKEGSEIVFDEERESEMVVRLLQFKKKLDTMWEVSFMKHEGLGHSLREAFETFINKSKKSNMTWGTDNPKPGEMIAKYVDMILRGGAKAIPTSAGGTVGTTVIASQDDADEGTLDEDQAISRQLEQVLDMFRFVHGKAVFEAFYKRDLARRLLMGRSASADAEKNMLSRLKTECGSGFTHNLEQMFKDIEFGREQMGSYRRMLQDRQKKTTFDLNVNVLSASAWPTYPDVKVEVPIDVQKATSDFEQYYKAKYNGRRLTWKHALAHCQLKGSFLKGNKEIVVSSFQAIVLLYFNDKAPYESIGYAELKEATMLGDDELKRTLQSLACAKYRVLTKTPKGKDVNDSDVFTVNLGFSDPKYRIKINQVQLKETKAENKETHERVAADRHYETQAAIVRILKSRKTIMHAELVAEVLQATKSRGALDPADIKKNIEKLIEKDYMEREEGRNAYQYLA